MSNIAPQRSSAHGAGRGGCGGEGGGLGGDGGGEGMNRRVIGGGGGGGGRSVPRRTIPIPGTYKIAAPS